MDRAEPLQLGKCGCRGGARSASDGNRPSPAPPHALRAARTDWRGARRRRTPLLPDRKSRRTAATPGAASDIGPDRDAAQHEFVVLAEESEKARLGRNSVSDEPVLGPELSSELIPGPAHVPVAGD